MLKKMFCLGLLVGGFLFSQIFASDSVMRLEGYYLTHIDDRGKQSVVEIFKEGERYYAYGFANIDGSTSVDDKNPNPKLRGRTMWGVVFVWDLKQKNQEWVDGKIYNYANGKTYDVAMWFNDKGNLVVKASVWGFGKKLIWKRLEGKEVEPYLGDKPPLKSVLATIP